MSDLQLIERLEKIQFPKNVAQLTRLEAPEYEDELFETMALYVQSKKVLEKLDDTDVNSVNFASNRHLAKKIRTKVDAFTALLDEIKFFSIQPSNQIKESPLSLRLNDEALTLTIGLLLNLAKETLNTTSDTALLNSAIENYKISNPGNELDQPTQEAIHRNVLAIYEYLSDKTRTKLPVLTQAQIALYLSVLIHYLASVKPKKYTHHQDLNLSAIQREVQRHFELMESNDARLKMTNQGHLRTDLKKLLNSV